MPESQGLLVKEEAVTESKIMQELRILGILNKTYIVGEMSGAMVMIDQHAAAERILYERFTEELRAEAVKTQKLLISELVHLSPKLFQTGKHFRGLLLELGYDTEDFGVSTIMVNTIPVVLGKQFNKTSFLDILDDLDKNGEPRSLEEFFHKRFARMACRTAIKAGDEITLPQIKKYIQDLGDLNVPYACPHGRPIIVKISFYEIEKMFKRVV
jgi:DNA mismatch repair protein MutL